MSNLPEPNEIPQTPRIGVWICDCGGRISGALDTPSLREHAAALPGVVYAGREAYPCSKAGQERMRRAISDYKLDRALIAGCAPRLVEKLFRAAVEPTGLEGDFVQIVNIREQCALAHPDLPSAATKKAAALIDMGIARLLEVQPSPHSSYPIVQSTVVIGSGLGGMALSLTLAERGMEVSLVEQTNRLGGSLLTVQGQAGELVTEMAAAVSNHPCIRTYLNRRVTAVAGQPGNFRVAIGQGAEHVNLVCGAIVLAGDAQPGPLDPDGWYDRRRVQSQAEFGIELEQATQMDGDLGARQIVMILQGDEPGGRVCCSTGIRQAARTRQINPANKVFVLFRELPLGETGKPELLHARELGVQFYRYAAQRPPQITPATVEVYDMLTEQAVSLPCDRIVLSTPLTPQPGVESLAALLHLPRDARGFLLEPRSRLRPERSRPNGIFVMGGSHLPADASETLFQAYLIGARVFNFLNHLELNVDSPTARIDPTACTGCGSCVQACSMDAIRLEKREGVLSLSQIDELRCTGCGSCVVACPVKAISLPGWEDQTLLAEIDAALRAGSRSETVSDIHLPLILAFSCEWSAAAAADIAGLRGYTYPPGVRIVPLNCSTRFDPNYALWALLNGADGVFVGACRPGECHYGTGNRFAEERIQALKEQLATHGIDPERVKFGFLSGDDGEAFARMMNQFSSELKMRLPKTLVEQPLAPNHGSHEREPAIGFAK